MTDVSELGVKIVGTGIVETGRQIESFSEKAKRLSARVEELGIKSTRAFDEIGNAVDAASDPLERFALLAGKAIGGALLAVGGALSVRKYVQYADTWSDLSARVQNAIGPMQDAREVMSGISEMARTSYSDLRLTAESFINNAQSLKELGLSTRDQLKYQESLNNALVVSGTRADRAAAVQHAFGAALALGALRGDQLNSVLINGDRIAKSLAKELGTTTNNLRKLGAEGKITREVMLRAMINDFEILRAEAEEMPATIGDGLTLVGNSMLTLVGSFDKMTGISEKAAKAIVLFSDGLKLAADNLWVLNAALLVVASRIAAAFAPAVISTIVGIAPAVAAFTASVWAAGGAVGGLTIALNLATVAARGFSFVLIGAVRGLVALFGGPVGLIIGSLTFLVTEFFRARANAKEFKDTMDTLIGTLNEASDAFANFYANMSETSLTVWREATQQAIEATEMAIKQAERSVANYEAMFQNLGFLPKVKQEYENRVSLVEQLRQKLFELQSTMGLIDHAASNFGNELARARGLTGEITEEQAKAYDNILGMLDVQRRKNELNAVGVQYGRESLQYLQMQQRHEAEIFNEKIKQLEIALAGVDAAQDTVVQLRIAFAETQAAETASWNWANAMAGVNAQIQAIARSLQAIAGFQIQATAAKIEGALLRKGVDAGQAAFTAQGSSRAMEYANRRKEVMASFTGNYDDPAFKTAIRMLGEEEKAANAAAEAQFELGLSREYAQETFGSSGGGGGGGRKGGGGGGGGGGTSEAQKALEAQRDAMADLQAEVERYRATVGMTALEEEIWNKQKEIGALQNPKLAAQVRDMVVELDALRSRQDAMRQMAQTVESAFGQAFSTIITGSGSAKDAIASLLKSLADMFANQAFQWLWKQIGGGITNAITGVSLGGNKVSAWTPPRNATGTPNWAGGVTRVHERGGEIMDLPGGTRIYPNDISKRMAKNDGGLSGKLEITIKPSGEFETEMDGRALSAAVSVVGGYNKSATMNRKVRQTVRKPRSIGA